MTPKRDVASNADDVFDVALHEQIKWRAYELYERHGHNPERHDLKNELRSDLLCVAYAAAQLQKHPNGAVTDSKVARAARVYLRALSSFIGQT